MLSRKLVDNADEKVVVIHGGSYSNNIVYYRLSHPVLTWDVDLQLKWLHRETNDNTLIDNVTASEQFSNNLYK